MKSAKQISGLLLVVAVISGGQARAAQSDQNAPEIRQEGDRKILVRIGGGNSGQSNNDQRPIKQMSEQQMQLLEQQRSATGGLRLPDATAVNNTDDNKSTFDGRPVLTQKTDSQETAGKKTDRRLRLVSKPDPNQGRSDVVEEIK